MNQRIRFFVLFFVSAILFLSCKSGEETKDSAVYEEIIQKNLGKDYEIMKKKLIYMKENVNAYLPDYRDRIKDRYSVSPYSVLKEGDAEWIACAAVNVSDRKGKPGVIVVMEKVNNGDAKIVQIIEKQVWDLFPLLFYYKNEKLILYIDYQAGTDWVDAFEYNKELGQFVELPESR